MKENVYLKEGSFSVDGGGDPRGVPFRQAGRMRAGRPA
jgi:hypothetical protein